MTAIVNFILIIICIISLCTMIKKYIKPPFKDIKKLRKASERDKNKYKALIIIFFAPIILWYLDAHNIFSKIYPFYSNISKEFDWLSFIGTYSGTIISAILLIFITENDRKENTNVLRESQRPYLDISYMAIKKRFFQDKRKNIIVFDHGNTIDKMNKQKEYLTLYIKNNGASVAIIDVNKTIIELQYTNREEIKREKLLLNFSINRLSIKSGDELYIKFNKKELYSRGKLLKNCEITSSKVYYKDLFNKNYFDECILLNQKIKVLHDNEEI